MKDAKSRPLEVLAVIPDCEKVAQLFAPASCCFNIATRVMDENTMMSQIETNLLGSVRLASVLVEHLKAQHRFFLRGRIDSTVGSHTNATADYA
jgi:NAD(P)-dependent dehydrogenase (short-subunit alcohol dehydrogenase family)